MAIKIPEGDSAQSITEPDRHGPIGPSKNLIVLIRLVPELQRPFPKPSLHAVRLDVLKPYAVPSGCPRIGLAAGIGMSQHVFSVHLVVQRIEAKAKLSLRFGM